MKHPVEAGLAREPGQTLGEGIGGLASALMLATGKHWLREVTIAADLGLAIGAEPGTRFQIMTPAGMVTVSIEATCPLR